MPRFEQLEIVDPAGNIQFVDLDPAVGLLNIGAHPDNDVTIDGPGVRPFHALLDYRRRPYQILLLNDGRPGDSATLLDQWHSVRLGNHEFLLAREDATESAPATPAIPLQTSQPTQLPALPALPPSPQSAPQNATQLSSDKSRYALTIHNSGNVTATFHIAVLDVAPDWVLVQPAQCSLPPNQQTEVTLSLHPELPAGSYTFSWQITSPDYGEWRQTGQLTLEATAPYNAIEWTALDPRLVQSRPFQRSGRAVFSLINRGTQPLRYFLWAKDLRGDCLVRFGLPSAAKQLTTINAVQSDQCELILPAGVEVPIELTIVPAQGRLVALRTLRYRFIVQGGFRAGGPVDHAISGTFESRPAIHGGWLLMLCLAVLVTTLIVFRAPIGAWIDSWRFGSAEAPTPLVLPTPALIHGFTAEELARYRQDEGVGGQQISAPQVLPGSYEDIFKEAGRRYNVDWRLLAALAYRESRLDAGAVGSAGEYGMMQIMPATWNEWAPLVQVSDPWDPYSNVLVGAAYLSYIHGYFSDIGFSDQRWAIAAYNLGPERVLRILDHGARWQDIPLPQRQYTADILMGLDEAPTHLARIDAEKN